MKRNIRFHAWWLPPTVILLFVLQWRDPSKLWTILLVTAALLLLFGWLWARSLQKNISLVREMRYGWAQVGDRMEERFVVAHKGVFPATWLEVRDQSTLPGYQVSIATTIFGKAETEWRTDGTCTRRGLYLLGGTRLVTGDPFGLFTVTLDDPARTTLMVMPPVVPLPPIHITPGGYSGDGRPRPRAPEETVGAAGVRPYQPGDSLRRIHWPTSAKRDSLYVRQFDGSPAGDWWVLLDLDKNVQHGSGWKATEEHGVILAASLCGRGLAERQSVGLIASSKELVWMPPRETPAQRWEILRALALAKPGETPLAALLERVRPNLGQRSTLVVITPSASAEWLDSLAFLMRKGIQPTVLWLDPTTFGAENPAGVRLPALLQEHNIPCYVISSDMLNQPDSRPGHRGVWEWRVSSITGKAIAVHSAGDAEWRRLG